jgi:transcription termination factor Rho
MMGPYTRPAPPESRRVSEPDEPVVVCPPFTAEGVLDILAEGHGFSRRPEAGYLPSPEDVSVPASLVRSLGLRAGMTVRGTAGPAGRRPALARVESVDGLPAAALAERVAFEDLTPLHPRRRLTLATGPDDFDMRLLDLVAPIGKGQRGLIVAPPRAGKTVLLQEAAAGLLHNHPECFVLVLLIDERPEEVTAMRRALAGPRAEVVGSTFDHTASEHVRVAELALERARRQVECGRDVVILLDSLTRLARAYNCEAPACGRIMTGGVAAGALDRPKRFFGAARCTEEGGSLTILATALVETGSRMDEVIFEEFKGTGNLEVVLDRRLADRRLWPAVDVQRSGTRREELLLGPAELRVATLVRKALADLRPAEALQTLTDRIRRTPSNAALV